MSGKTLVIVLALPLVVVLPAAFSARGSAPPAGPVRAASTAAPVPAAADAGPDVIYGRVTTAEGTYEGRLRFGGDEEAFWGDFFNGYKDENPWAAYAPFEPPLEIFRFKIRIGAKTPELGRPFMTRFGDITRLEAHGRDLRVTLKSGTVVRLDRFGADDYADGVRVWDPRRGVVDLDEWDIQAIDLLPGSGTAPPLARLHGTVRTAAGDFTGFVQWNRHGSVSADELTGRMDGHERRVPFDDIRSIARLSPVSALVTLRDGRELVLSGTRDVGREHRGVFVDDDRYGRVLVSRDAFERVDFGPAGRSPAYQTFLPGRPLSGTVTTQAGRRLTGRLVYDLDESETTETLDAPWMGVNYSLPFGLVASVVLGPPVGARAAATVRLQDGNELSLERAGDLADSNGGLLVFEDGPERPEYLPWTDVAQVDFVHPSPMSPEK
ncbi:MAG: hypothetical protein AB7O67_02265 [Vicinamibacterales bacterium]